VDGDVYRASASDVEVEVLRGALEVVVPAPPVGYAPA
jgi:hypothetical protein